MIHGTLYVTKPVKVKASNMNDERSQCFFEEIAALDWADECTILLDKIKMEAAADVLRDGHLRDPDSQRVLCALEKAYMTTESADEATFLSYLIDLMRAKTPDFHNLRNCTLIDFSKPWNAPI